MKNILTVSVKPGGKISFFALYPQQLEIRLIKDNTVETITPSMLIVDASNVEAWVNTVVELEWQYRFEILVKAENGNEYQPCYWQEIFSNEQAANDRKVLLELWNPHNQYKIVKVK